MMLNLGDRLASPAMADFPCWATLVSPTWGGRGRNRLHPPGLRNAYVRPAQTLNSSGGDAACASLPKNNRDSSDPRAAP